MGPRQANTIHDVGVEHPAVADVKAEEVASQWGDMIHARKIL